MYSDQKWMKISAEIHLQTLFQWCNFIIKWYWLIVRVRSHLMSWYEILCQYLISLINHNLSPNTTMPKVAPITAKAPPPPVSMSRVTVRVLLTRTFPSRMEQRRVQLQSAPPIIHLLCATLLLCIYGPFQVGLMSFWVGRPFSLWARSHTWCI